MAISRIISTAIKLGNIMYSRYYGKIPRYLPILIAFVTYRCNLRCAMCGLCELREQSTLSELTTEEWFSVLDSASRLGTMIISISGGEPLLRKDLEEIIYHAELRNIATHLCTNGSMIDERRAISLRESRLRTISFSLDSADPQIHDTLRGPFQFESTLEGIHTIRAKAPRIKISINTVITRLNYKGLSRLVELAKALGAYQIKFAPLHTNLLHRYKHDSVWRQFFIPPEEVVELKRELQLAQVLCKKYRILTTSYTFYQGIPQSIIAPNPFTCYAGFLDCIITPDGRVGSCCDYESPLSVRNQTLEQIWYSPKFHSNRLLVCQCKKYCWDTTNTEFSLRLDPATFVRELPTMWREFLFYLR